MRWFEMGEPAAVFVKHADGAVDVHTWGSGGYSLGQELIELGVERLVAKGLQHSWRKEAEQSAGPLTRGSLPWAESMLVVDEAEKVIIWNLPCLEVESPRLVSYMIEATSPGWRAAWCPAYSDGAWRYFVGDSTARLVEQRHQHESWEPREDLFGPFEMPEHGFAMAILFTAVLQDGRSACWLADADEPDRVPRAKACQLEAIAERMTDTAFEQYALWPNRDDGDSDYGYDEWPSSGMHLDFATRTAWCWHVYHADFSDAASDKWPGWRFIDVGDWWELQEGRTHGREIAQPIRDVLHEAMGLRSDGTPLSTGSGSLDYYHFPRFDVLKAELLESGVEPRPTAFPLADGTVCWDPSLLGPAVRTDQGGDDGRSR